MPSRDCCFEWKCDRWIWLVCLYFLCRKRVIVVVAEFHSGLNRNCFVICVINEPSSTCFVIDNLVISNSMI